MTLSGPHAHQATRAAPAKRAALLFIEARNAPANTGQDGQGANGMEAVIDRPDTGAENHEVSQDGDGGGWPAAIREAYAFLAWCERQEALAGESPELPDHPSLSLH